MNYLILGANAAGMSAAVRIRKWDKSATITVLEKSDVVSFGSCGIPFYVAGEFSDIDQMTARSFEDFVKSGIDIRLFHSATSIDSKTKRVIAVDGKANVEIEFPYDKLLIAVGASPVRPPIGGLTSPDVYTMHSKYDAIAIAERVGQVKSVTVIGGGFIGIEAAEAFREKGKQVRLIEFADRILERTFDEQITELLEQTLLRHDISLHKNERVLEIVHEGSGNRILTDKGDYRSDLIVLAAGFKPNTGFLNGSDIALNAQGAIVIDDQCRTNIADVFAAGDCASVRHCIAGDMYLPLATTANKLGRLAGDIMAGQNGSFIGTLGSCGIRVFDMETGRTGISEADAKRLGLDYAIVFIKDKNHTDYVKDQTDIWVKLIYEKNNRKLLGGQICGAYLGGSVHRIDALAVAIYSGLTVEELGFMDFVYAPPFARTWDVMNVAGNVAK